jgi:hypothetical protein
MECLTWLRRPYFRALVMVWGGDASRIPWLKRLDLKAVLDGDEKIWNFVTVDWKPLVARVERIVPAYGLRRLRNRFRAEVGGSAIFLPAEREELERRRFLHICDFTGNNSRFRFR